MDYVQIVDLCLSSQILSPVIQSALHPAVTFQLSYCVLLFLLYFFDIFLPFLEIFTLLLSVYWTSMRTFFLRVIFNSF